MNICFTGHRPNKLGGYDWNTAKNMAIMKKLSAVVIHIINKESDKFKFICGGALGIDQMAFAICHSIKKNPKIKNKDIHLEVAVPFKRQHKTWVEKLDIARYKKQLEDACKVTYVDAISDYKVRNSNVGDYHIAKLHIRNQYMVDNSDMVIAVWDGSDGGTKNCIDYAKKQGKRIIGLNPVTLQLEKI